MEVVAHYGEVLAEYAALREQAGLLDLSFRGRVCLTGKDRQRFLHGQVTNNIKELSVGEGCYAALVTAKGKLVSDMNIYCLAEEYLLDFEPGLTERVTERLNQYIIADDVRVVDAAPHYGLLSVQGPQSGAVVNRLGIGAPLPSPAMRFVRHQHPALGEIFCMNHSRGAALGFDLFIPAAGLAAAAEQLFAGAREKGGRACGWQALEMTRLEAGIPRFGADMDETNLAPEAGIESRAISYAKGCYIGQEVIARIRTYGQVAKVLRGLKLADDLAALPARGDKLFFNGKEAGYITSAMVSPALNAKIALGYTRREANQIGNELVLRTGGGESRARVVGLPF